MTYNVFGWTLNLAQFNPEPHNHIWHLLTSVHNDDTAVSDIWVLLGPFYGAIAVPSVTCCRRRGHQCARHLVNGRAAARSGEWAQNFSNASCSDSEEEIKTSKSGTRIILDDICSYLLLLDNTGKVGKFVLCGK